MKPVVIWTIELFKYLRTSPSQDYLSACGNAQAGADYTERICALVFGGTQVAYLKLKFSFNFTDKNKNIVTQVNRLKAEG